MAICGKCIHLDVCKTADSCDGHVPRCKHFMDKTAISEALEKQKPQRPEIKGDGGYCPRCRQGYEIDLCTPDYCGECGQALKWEEENV